MYTEQLKQDIVTMINSLRIQLAKEFNVSDNGSNPYYAGLCYEISSRFVDEFNRKYCIDGHFPVACIAHGEIKHSPWIAHSDNWSWEHTWVEVRTGNHHIIYVDGSCSQFRDILDDIPEYYVSSTPPKWFLNDRNNIVFKRGILRTINERVKIKRKLNGRIVKEGIIEFLSYDIWGFISDTMRRTMLHETKQNQSN